MTLMKPIIFSTAMVQAILAGRKTQTRRVIKTPPFEVQVHGHDRISVTKPRTFAGNYCRFHPYAPIEAGDILWVRETWRKTGFTISPYAYKADKNALNMIYCWKPSIHMPRAAARIFLRVKDVRVGKLQDISEEDAWREGCRGKPACIGISACGTPREACSCCRVSGKEEFQALWDSLNAKRGYGWDVNPWVWVIEFEGCEEPKWGVVEIRGVEKFEG